MNERLSRTARALLVLVLAVNGPAWSQATQARPTGLPKKVSWTFNLDAGFGAFGFANSLYLQTSGGPTTGNLSDNWFESYVKPALSGVVQTGPSQVFGALSFVGERTFSAPPPLVGGEASSFQVEDAYLGWRSGTAIGGTENALEFKAGRTQYRIGHGLLLWDGGGEGGSRGGFWSNARKAWELAAVAAFRPRHHNLELFYLDRDEVPESETGTRMFGANYELSLGEANTFGFSYIQTQAYPSALAARDGMSIINLRAYTAPLRRVPGLAFELEYVREENEGLISSTAWNGQAAYEFGGMGWKPRLSYRYAYFQGDDPITPDNESFDSFLTGFYDWGTWWQGEIGGEYFLSNSNLISHQVRVHVTPSERISGGLIGYSFVVDQPATFGSTSTSLATELDAYADWKLNSNFTVSIVAAYANPGDAANQALGRTSNFTYGMLYVAYAF